VVPAAGRYPAAAGDLAGDREHNEYVTAQLKAGVRVSTVRQRLRDEHGLAVSVQSFRRYVAANVPEDVRRAQVRVLDPNPAGARSSRTRPGPRPPPTARTAAAAPGPAAPG
jgi:hypothetical protein